MMHRVCRCTLLKELLPLLFTPAPGEEEALVAVTPPDPNEVRVAFLQWGLADGCSSISKGMLNHRVNKSKIKWVEV